MRNSVMVKRAQENRSYLLELDTDALLFNHRMEACIAASVPQEKAHGGWEHLSCQVRGQFLGHWLSAAAMHYASTGDLQIKAKADEIVQQLALCQAENGGEWVGSIPEKYLHRIARGKPVWAPHYTIHKTFMGLVDMHLLAGNAKALDVAENWAKWFLRWTDGFDREQMDDILDVETGGMLEIWAELYGITGKQEYQTLMGRYYRGRLFDPLLEGKDVLTNMHANTTIPEVLGAAKAYEVTGEEKWLRIVRAYWDCAVTKRGSFCTGGQTSGEIWTPMGRQAARLGDKNQEHCTVYNMMRLADFLFQVTGEARYADYWEQNLYNGIMAQAYWRGSFTHGQKSEHPTTGLLTYFLPLRAGGIKAWSSKTNDFFCCHGTLVQANASLDRGVYYQSPEGFSVCQYLASTLHAQYGGTGVTIEQDIDTLTGSGHHSSVTGTQTVNEVAAAYPGNPNLLMSVVHVLCEKEAAFSLRMRIPWWAKGEVALLVNGQPVDAKMDGKGFAVIRRTWKDDTVEVCIPKGLTAWPLPDEPNTAAFLYGPVVLAGLCTQQTALYGDLADPDAILAPDNEREWGTWMETFRTVGQPQNLRLVPLHRIGYEPYTVYFPVQQGTGG